MQSTSAFPKAQRSVPLAARSLAAGAASCAALFLVFGRRHRAGACRPTRFSACFNLKLEQMQLDNSRFRLRTSGISVSCPDAGFSACFNLTLQRRNSTIHRFRFEQAEPRSQCPDAGFSACFNLTLQRRNSTIHGSASNKRNLGLVPGCWLLRLLQPDTSKTQLDYSRFRFEQAESRSRARMLASPPAST